MKEYNKDWFGKLSLISGILLLCAILMLTVSSLKTTGQCYSDLKNTDLSQGTESMLYYDDHMYCMAGFGISIVPNEDNGQKRLSSFLASSIKEINKRIITCGLLYSMIVGVVIQYYIYSRYHTGKKYFFAIAISSVAPFVVFAVTLAVAQMAFSLPVLFQGVHEWSLVAIGLLSIVAGNFAINAILHAVRHKKLAAVIIVPAVLLLYIVSMNLEYHLYTSSTKYSFAYFNETYAYALEDDYEGECYYDEDKKVMILDGAEYPPEIVDNPDCYTGWKRPCAFLFELADACSGNGLMLIEAIIDDAAIPLWVIMAYAVKSAVWIAFSSCLMKHRFILNQIS